MFFPIYKAELQDGLSDKLKVVRANAICVLQNVIPDITRNRLDVDLKQRIERAFGASKDSFDLFPLYSILVTTGWNKNDDVFGKTETWKARYTPEDKPFNLEHEPSKIIGHVTASCAVNEDLTPIADDTPIDDLPSKYHILTSSVIYRPANDRNPEWTKATNELIEEINAGKWCVSMECIFNDFDYAVIDFSGKQSIVARNEETAFLTKHLKTYGGAGSFNDKKLGRFVKNITFSGKGLTRKPANPDSVIFTDVSMFEGLFASADIFLERNGVNTISNKQKKEIIMPDSEKTIEQENTELKVQVASLTEQLNKINIEESQKKITDLMASLETKTNELVQVQNVVAEKDKEISQLKTDAETIKTAKAEVEKSLAQAEEKISNLSISVSKANRTASLYQYDIDPKEIESIVTKFVTMADDQFTEMISLIAAKKKKDKMEKKAKEGKDGNEESCATASTNANANDSGASAADVVDSAAATSNDIVGNASTSNEDKVMEVRNSLKSYFSGLLNTKKKKD